MNPATVRRTESPAAIQSPVVTAGSSPVVELGVDVELGERGGELAGRTREELGVIDVVDDPGDELAGRRVLPSGDL